MKIQNICLEKYKRYMLQQTKRKTNRSMIKYRYNSPGHSNGQSDLRHLVCVQLFLRLQISPLPQNMPGKSIDKAAMIF